MEYIQVLEREALQDKPDVGFKSKPVYDFFKRVFDIVCSFLALVVLLPFLIVVAIAIMIDDYGNPIFVQERTGKNSKPFKMYKLRSMRMHAEKELESLSEYNEYNDVHFKMSNDPRVTRVGAFIRKISIDELPQLLNVLKGDMSIIGPRPFIPSEQDQLPSDRLLVKPGLSCYWQITDTQKLSSEEQLELDYKYIRERSFLTDIKVIFRTIGVVFKHNNY